MKISSRIVALALLPTASAFTTSSSSSVHTSLSSAAVEDAPAATALPEINNVKYDTEVNPERKFRIANVDPAIFNPRNRVQTGRYNDREMSVALPFLKRPTQLDGTHAGDVGFDPLGLSESNDMYTMMEAELRHARLAMLAVVGWPLSELLAPKWLLHGPNNIAPSVLNGFDPLTFITTAAIFGAFGYFEYNTALRRTDDKELGQKHSQDMANVWKYGVPGDYNFDPLGLYSMFGDDATGRKAMRELEIAHGRSAMLGITAFAAWEALTGHAIVENNLLFHPNAVVPAAALAYIAFGFFYEIESTDQYLFQVKKSSEGEVRMQRIQNWVDVTTPKVQDKAEVAFEKAKEYYTITSKNAKELKEKYNSLNDDYTKNVMSKNYDV